jgi:hypothetical protein
MTYCENPLWRMSFGRFDVQNRQVSVVTKIQRILQKYVSTALSKIQMRERFNDLTNSY